MSMPKSLFRVEFWLREAEGITKPERTEHMVFTRQEMQAFAVAEREKDEQYNCVYYWVCFDRDVPRPNYPDYPSPDVGGS